MMSKVYIYYMDRGLTDDEYRVLELLLPPDKKQNLQRFYYKADADRALLSQVIRRYAISLKTKIPYGELFFSQNDFGKPLLQNDPNLHFNISHGGRYVACAIDEQPIGIDVEEIPVIKKPLSPVEPEPLVPDPLILGIADRFFCDNEKQYLHQVPLEQRMHAFLEIWTMKESYIKRQGKGLSIPLDSFDVLSTNNVFFHKVFQTPTAVCHVCMSKGGALQCPAAGIPPQCQTASLPPSCRTVTIGDLLAMVTRSSG